MTRDEIAHPIDASFAPHLAHTIDVDLGKNCLYHSTHASQQRRGEIQQQRGHKMEHLIVNHQDMVSAEVEMVITGKRLGMFRVIMRDLDADAVIAIRFFPRDRRADAIAFADDIVNIVA